MNTQYLDHAYKAQQCLVFGLILLMALCFPRISLADDTEIYLGEGTPGTAIKHNVLFVLDTSGSMKRRVFLGGPTNGFTRISILRLVLDDLISSLNNLKIGYLRMNGSRFVGNRGSSQPTACIPGHGHANQTLINAGAVAYGSFGGSGNVKPDQNNTCYLPTGGTVLFPVADLDAQVNSVSPGSGDAFTITVPIINGDDDVQEIVGGTLTLDSNALDLGAVQCSPLSLDIALTSSGTNFLAEVISSGAPVSGSRRLGRHELLVRFPGVNVPIGSSILSASIALTALPVTGGGSRSLDVPILGLNNAGVTATVSGSGGIGNLSSSGTDTFDDSILWDAINAVVTAGGVFVTPAGGVFVTPDLSVLLQEMVDEAGWSGNGTLGFIFGGQSGQDFLPIHQSNDLPRLRIDYCPPGSSAINSVVGLRFQDVSIPQGAVIDAARIDFIGAPVGSNIGSSAIDGVNIASHLHDDSPAFIMGQNLSLRSPRSTPNLWTAQEMDEWLFENTETTNDISAQVQAVVDRTGWCGGNAMSFLIANPSTTANVTRRAFSYENDPTTAAVLRVSYTSIYDAADTGCNVRIATVFTGQRNHEARQFPNGGVLTINGNFMQLGYVTGTPITPDYRGLMFELPINAGATVMQAFLDVTLDGQAQNLFAAGTTIPERTARAVIISAQNDVDPQPFATTLNNLSPNVRPRVGSTVSWDIPGLAINAGENQVLRVDVTPLVQSIISQSGWSAGQNLALFIENDRTVAFAGPQAEGRFMYSHAGDPRRAPRLFLTYQEDRNSGSFTVREQLLQINNAEFNLGSLLAWTPSVETLFEAALYWRGKDVLFGRRRGSAHLGAVPHVKYRRDSSFRTIDFTSDMDRTLTSHPASWSGGTYVSDPRGTDCQLSHSPNCSQDRIDGSPRYISPIRSGEECAGNYQIFMTDGIPTWVNQQTVDQITTEFPSFNSCSVNPTVNARRYRGRCGVEMLRDMATVDQRPDLPGDQLIKTYTIAFNITDSRALRWLEQLATAGGGSFYDASSASELSTVFDDIIREITPQRPSSFAAPGISANAFNRLFSRDEIYFGLFEPTKDSKWDGNLKKYRLCTETDPDNDGMANCTLGNVIDANGAAAIDTTGLFATGSRSLWTNATADGRELRVGGAGAEQLSRKLYTEFVPSNPANGVNSPGSTAPGGKLASDPRFYIESGPSIRNLRLGHFFQQICGSTTVPNTACLDRLTWTLGLDRRDEDGDGDLTEKRWWFSSILHSSPVAVTYGQAPDPNNPGGFNFIDKILVGSNDGALHMINGQTGHEHWVFMPFELLQNQRRLYDNPTVSGTNNIYGLDLTPVVYVEDTNNNGIVEPSENDYVHVFLGMRRGGSSYYALNITPSSTITTNGNNDLIQPELLWKIKAQDTSSFPAPQLAAEHLAEGNFSRLGQTWSEPVVADILCSGAAPCDNGRIKVVIFGGGYDADALDAGGFGLQNGQPNLGNAIYIVNESDGELLLWFSHEDVAASGIRPAIAASGADIEVPDMLYSIISELTVLDSNGDGFSDRFYVGDAGGQVWRVDLAANIRPSATSNAAKIGDTAIGRLANISVITDPTEQRRFHYQPTVAQIRDDLYSDAANGAYDYVVMSSGDRANPLNLVVDDALYAIRDRHITPLTANADGLAIDYPLGSISGAPITEADLIDITTQALVSGDAMTLASNGWYFRFLGDGQKGLAEAVIIAGSVLTTSYLPADGSSSNVCGGGGEGTGIAHNLSILDARATLDWDGDGDVDDADRSQELQGGIPSAVIPIFTREGVTLAVSTGGGMENLGAAGSPPRFRTYWSETETLF